MHLKRLEITGFKSFAKKSVLEFTSPVSAIVGPNGSGKSNIAESIRFVLGEQSIKSLRGKRGEDMIFSGTKLLPRQNRAKVTIVFDNVDRIMDIDYDEVSFSREVHRDSSHQYFINNSQVRLKDVHELLASVHIGASGHHIISQGEADRILGASLKERKTMIEDALGLKVHQFKITESEKRLAKTEDNIVQVGLLQRELAPHLRFLKGQVKKIEQAREMRTQLEELYKEYLKREELYLSLEKKTIEDGRKGPQDELVHLKEDLAKAEGVLREVSSEKDQEKQHELKKLEELLGAVRQNKNEISRELGRIEGVIEYERNRSEETEKETKKDTDRMVSAQMVQSDIENINQSLQEAENASDLEQARTIIGRAKSALGELSQKLSFTPDAEQEVVPTDTGAIAEMTQKSTELQKTLVSMTEEEAGLSEKIAQVRQEMEHSKDESRDSEKVVFELRAREREIASQLSVLNMRSDQLEDARMRFKEELREGSVLIGRAVLSYEGYNVEESAVREEARSVQEDRRRSIEKIKIRLEDMGGGSGEDVAKEYEETVERNEFLEKEVHDLEESAVSLRSLIQDLQKKLSEDFRVGVKKINTQFQEFFALMFGGGSAELLVVQDKKPARKIDGEEVEVLAEEEDEVIQEGIEIDVNLPGKNIKGLQMLSGGERALTSIALLFAISQVNPPPFLVLDETDAALDEANSRKYGDMLENLSHYSQLIVITHNRETMSRAGILYGVTMDSDSASKLLSIKFTEAEAYAK